MDVVKDVVIGMSDGLTVPFALAAGISGAVTTTGLIVTAGLAEIAAGSIAMGLGGFLAARTQAEHYKRERQREVDLAREPETVEARVVTLLRSYGLPASDVGPVAEAVRRRPQDWVEFLMGAGRGLHAVDPRRAWTSGLTIGFSYAAGGFVPLASYIALRQPLAAFLLSIPITATALMVFGYVKGAVTGAGRMRSAVETIGVGGAAAAAAYLLARAITL